LCGREISKPHSGTFEGGQKQHTFQHLWNVLVEIVVVVLFDMIGCGGCGGCCMITGGGGLIDCIGCIFSGSGCIDGGCLTCFTIGLCCGKTGPLFTWFDTGWWGGIIRPFDCPFNTDGGGALRIFDGITIFFVVLFLAWKYTF